MKKISIRHFIFILFGTLSFSVNAQVEIKAGVNVQIKKGLNDNLVNPLTGVGFSTRMYRKFSTDIELLYSRSKFKVESLEQTNNKVILPISLKYNLSNGLTTYLGAQFINNFYKRTEAGLESSGVDKKYLMPFIGMEYQFPTRVLADIRFNYEEESPVFQICLAYQVCK